LTTSRCREQQRLPIGADRLCGDGHTDVEEGQSAANVGEHDLHWCNRPTWRGRTDASTRAVRRGTPCRVVGCWRVRRRGLDRRGQRRGRWLRRIPRLDAEEITEL